MSTHTRCNEQGQILEVLGEPTAEEANAATIEQRAAAALETNRTFLAISGTPTNAQVIAQVRALTRQNQALIRLVLDRLDGTD